jgi:hypothetical protein
MSLLHRWEKTERRIALLLLRAVKENTEFQTEEAKIAQHPRINMRSPTVLVFVRISSEVPPEIEFINSPKTMPNKGHELP